MPDSRDGPRLWPYIIAVIIMALLGVTAILVLTVMRPQEDNIVVITLILGFLAPTTLSLLAFMKGQETNVQTQETHKIVNSELEKRVTAEKAQSKSEGITEGQGMTMVSRTQGPIEVKVGEPPIPPNIGFKITSTYMRGGDRMEPREPRDPSPPPGR